MRMPTLFVPHGGGPWTIVDMGLAEMYAPLRQYLAEIPSLLPARPTAILCVSAHWEANAATVQAAAHPPMLYDYSGFPPESYAYKWSAPGSPELATRVRALLAGAGIEAASDSERGFDHGTFVPLMVPYPDADIPTLQLSLLDSLDPEPHLALGRALAPLRDEGVLIVGSGMSYHNMGGFRAAMGGGQGRAQVERDSSAFDGWMLETVRCAREERERRLAAWASAPSARGCHPREEHLLPLMVVAGAAGDDAASVPLQTSLSGARVSAVHFGG